MGAWPQTDGRSVLRLAHVDDYAQAARLGINPPDQPLALREACEAARVRITRQCLKVGERRHAAMLVPTADGFRAVVDSLVWRRAQENESGRHRLRFILAHELGHTLFYRPGRPPTRSGPADSLEERFCHRFATSLLVPPCASRRADLDAAGLRILAGKYNVSVRVAAWAVAQALPGVTLLWLRRAPHPVHGGSETMRVEWGASQRFIARGESFKSPLAELPPGQHGRSTEQLRLSGREEHLTLDAWRFTHSMLVIARPAGAGGKAEPPAQRTLF